MSEPARPIRDAPAPERRAIWGRLVLLVATVVALYVLWPSLLKVFAAWPELLRLNPSWFIVMFAAELASFACIWMLQRLALRTKQWFGVATSQLAGNAFSRIVPGGAAAGGAISYRLLLAAGIPAATVGTGLATASIISTATLFSLPLLALPAALAGRPVPMGLAQSAWLGAGVFVLAMAVGTVFITTDGPLRATGRVIQMIRNRMRRGRAPTTDLPDRLVSERDQVRSTLGRRWWVALLSSLGNWLFDYLALLAALAAVGSRPRPTLVLLAYVSAMVLGMIPITPGGLGFVEAGLTATLTLAGVSAPDAVLATLAYRMVSYWLPLPMGLLAATLHRRRFAPADAV
ncbi:MAG: lysylphosphatidylglycerol synthase transmembrane domain-containing protein [Actinomycetota bacterium]